MIARPDQTPAVTTRSSARRRSATFIAAALFVAAGTAAGPIGTVEAASGSGHYDSRPDLFHPPIDVTVAYNDADDTGLIFATPAETDVSSGGVMIYDDDGELVWFHPVPDLVVGDAAVETLDGEQVLTWFEGTAPFGRGNYRGEWVVVDESYEEVTRIRMGNDVQADIHDLHLTPDGTALMMAYQPIECDAVVLADCEPGATILDGVIQEVDVATGAVLFEWHATDHIPLSASYQDPTDDPFDYIHLNSLDLDEDGNILVSARNTSALYKLDRVSGDVMFEFGGRNDDFTRELGQGVTDDVATTGPDYPHDFRPRGDGTYSYFDNGVQRDGQSRGVVVTLDPDAGVATVIASLAHEPELGAPTQGRMQELPDGGNLVSWGGLGVMTEFDAGGTPRFETRFGLDGSSYRQVRQQWTGAPTISPQVAVVDRRAGAFEVAVSWNGDTLTESWQVLSGPDPAALNAAGTFPRTGFETTIEAADADEYVALQALDSSGAAIEGGLSRTVRNGSFFVERTSADLVDRAQPLVGDFGGTRNDDIFYYAPGTTTDRVHLADGLGGFDSYVAPAVDGDYEPVVGDFIGDDRDEVLFRAPGDDTAFMWRFDTEPRTSAPSVRSSSVDVSEDAIEAVLLDHQPSFGGGKDEILFYAPGTTADHVQRFEWPAGGSLESTEREVDVDDEYTPVSGDFDGNGLADVLWYAPGLSRDFVWLTEGDADGSTSQRSVRVDVDGDYAVIAADLMGARSTDELLFFGTGEGADYVWSVAPDGGVASLNVTAGVDGEPYALSGPTDRIMAWDGGSPMVWSLDPERPERAASGNTAVGDGHQPIIGDFVGAGGTSSVLWFAPGDEPEVLYSPDDVTVADDG